MFFIPKAFREKFDAFRTKNGLSWKEIKESYGIDIGARKWSQWKKSSANAKTFTLLVSRLHQKELLKPDWKTWGLLEVEVKEVLRTHWLGDIALPEEFKSAAEKEMERPRSSELAASRESIQLQIGLASEHQRPFNLMIQIYQEAKENESRRITFSPRITPLTNEDAHRHFLERAEDYDILLLDDIWLPYFAQKGKLRPLSELWKDQDHRNQKARDRFLPNLLSACRYPDGGDSPLYGLPLLGNVQLLFFVAGKDLSDPPIKGQEGICKLLRQQCSYNSNCGSAAKYFHIRNSSSEIVENFWQFLRVYDHHEETRDGRILIPRQAAEQVLKWMDSLDPAWRRPECLHIEEVLDGLIERGNPRWMWGWPSFLFASQSASYVNRSIGICHFPECPVMGVWSLAVTQASAFPEEAADLVWTLSASASYQYLLAILGNVPVLAQPSYSDELKRLIPFWDRHYETIRSALEKSRPRPRVPNWPEAQRRLAQLLLNSHGELQDDSEGYFAFVDCP